MSIYQLFGKRCFDLVLSLAALVVLSPVLLVLALLVRIRLGSPVLFVQERLGLQGRPFRLCKFRTMTDARNAAGKLLPDAQRMTRFGNFLRVTSLDELPELCNVIRGDMSLIGPRPLLMQYLDRYSSEQARRHEVRPGITGWAQVNGRNEIQWEEKFELDVWYVDNCSWLVDIEILFLTVVRVAQQDGISSPGEATAAEFMGTPTSVQPVLREDDSVIVIGAGGHAKVVISMLQARGHHIAAAYTDDASRHGEKVLGVPIRGPLSDLDNMPHRPAVVAIGDCALRQTLVERFGFQWLRVIHPTAWIHPSAKLGEGVVICAGAVVQPDATIGKHAIVNTCASVDHDCQVGDFAHLGPGAHLAGDVRIGNQTFMGTGSSAIPAVAIGNCTTVGAGAVVIEDLPDHVVAAGCPARVKRLASTQRKAA